MICVTILQKSQRTNNNHTDLPPPIYQPAPSGRVHPESSLKPTTNFKSPSPTTNFKAPAPTTNFKAPANNLQPTKNFKPPTSKPGLTDSSGSCAATDSKHSTDGEWACAACTFLNVPTKVMCAICGQPRPKAPAPPSQPSTHTNTRSPPETKPAAPAPSTQDAATSLDSGGAPQEQPEYPVIAAKVELPQAVNCLANCGFYGTTAKKRLCNKCYDELKAQSAVDTNAWHASTLNAQETHLMLHSFAFTTAIILICRSTHSHFFAIRTHPHRVIAELFER